MKYKFTKILVFSFFLALTSCGTGENENASDYSDEEELNINNEKNVEYRPDGDYDTLSNKEIIAKDRRNHRKERDDETEEVGGDTTNQINLHPGKEPHDVRSNHEGSQNEENEEQDATKYMEDNSNN